MKRIRSKKIENDKKLSVLYEKDLDASRIQEYSKTTFTTGVEKDEEEEHHLKAVISGREEAIPTPRIEKKRAPCDSSRKEKIKAEEDLEEYLKDIGDVENASLSQAQPAQDAIAQSEEDLPKTLHPYVCFRRREIKSHRKTRKLETSIEKIKRLKVDLQMMRRLAELSMQRDTYLVQHLNTILSIFNICREMNKRLDIGVLNISESILRDILFTKLISKNDLFYKKIPSFTNLYSCRKSIGSLKKLIKAGPPQEECIDLTKKEMDYLNTYL